MKPCKPVYQHIDQDEFGDGRKITTSLLKRYCQNISGLWKKTRELEDSTDPELKKMFNPIIIHETHSYGMIKNAQNGYEFNNSEETYFTDNIGLKKVELGRLTPVQGHIYQRKLETTKNINDIMDDKEVTYTKTDTQTELEEKERSYYLDSTENIIYVNVGNVAVPPVLYIVIHSTDPYIDFSNTTAYVNLTKHVIQVPYSTDDVNKEVLDQNTAIQYLKDGNGTEYSVLRPVERYWNFGWRRLTQFWMYPLWLQDPFGENPLTPPMSTVSRAFIITPRQTGLLNKIRLMFNVKNGAEDEAYCEIRETTPDGFPSNHILAREKTRIRGINHPILHTINFKTPPHLEKGKKYAVVVRAGFTSSDKSYGLGGWSFATYGKEFIGNIFQKIANTQTGTTTPSKKRIYGFDEDILSDIFHSIDNGRTWIKAHSINLAGFVEDAFDGMRPRAFSYQTFIQPLNSTPQHQKGSFNVYWKPIRTNPIRSVQLTPTTQGKTIKWDVSTNMIDWHQIQGPDWSHDFENGDEHEKNKHTLYIRAQLTTTENAPPPEINGLKVVLKTYPAQEAYIKTLFYNPRLSNPLGASLWSGIGTNITTTPPQTNKTKVEVDIIRNIIQKDDFVCDGKTMEFMLTEKPAQPLLKVTMIPTQYNENTANPEPVKTPATGQNQNVHKTALNKLKEKIDIIYKATKVETSQKDNPGKCSPETVKQLADHMINTQSIVISLQDDKHVWKDILNSFSKFKSLEECDKHACVLNYCVILQTIILNTLRVIESPDAHFVDVLPSIPGRDIYNLELTENRDYTVNYKTGQIKLTDAWGIGELKVEYNPLWLQNLDVNDFPLKTDLFEEKFTNNNNHDTFKLRAIPLDPVRSVEIFNDTLQKWEKLTENQDYHINYPQKELKLLTDNKKTSEDTTRKYRVRYTPYLVDNGLALAYKMHRTDLNAQASIESCYYQNRV